MTASDSRWEAGPSGSAVGFPDSGADGADRTLLFLHIPKTGGSTLTRILRRQYASGRIFEVETDLDASLREFRGLSEEARRSFQLVAGHMDFSLHEDIPGRTSYFTMFRDPVERVISTFYFVRRKPNHPVHDEVVGRGMSLAEALRSGVLPMCDNGQVRSLLGIDHLREVPYGSCTKEHLNRARRNLDHHVEFVGVTELFDESLLLMRERFGWGNVFYTPRNTNPERPGRDAVSEEARGLIRELNALDIQLYAECRERLEEEISRRGVSFTLRLRGFRSMNRLRSALLPAYRRVHAAVE